MHAEERHPRARLLLRASLLGAAAVAGATLATASAALPAVAHADDGRLAPAAPSGERTPSVAREAPALDASWILDSDRDAHGLRVRRYHQELFGLRVEGAEAIVRTRPDGAVDHAFVSTPAPVGARPPTLTRRTLDAAALARLARSLDVGFTIEAIDPSEEVLADLSGGEGPPRVGLAHRLEVRGAGLHERARVLVEGGTLRVLRVEPLLRDARGLVYLRNAALDEGATTEVELPALSSPDALGNSAFTVRSCVPGRGGECTPIAHATPDDDGNFLYAPEPASFEDGFSEVMAYYHANRAASYFDETHGFRWRCAAVGVSEPDSMRVYTNYTDSPGSDFANAGYMPGTRRACGYLIFGQSGEFDFAADADVVYHEFAHSMTDALTSMSSFATDTLSLHYEPLAVNEGMSDYWAAGLQGDPHIGESLEGLEGTTGSSALRDIDGALACPADLMGEAHFDGRIWAGALWDLREAIGGEKMDAIAFATIASAPMSPTLRAMGELALATATSFREMGTIDEDDLETVRALLAARGLLDCQRIVPLDDGESHIGFSGIAILTRGPGQGIAPIHYSLELPPDAIEADVEISALTLAGSFTIHGRDGQPVSIRSGIRSDRAEAVGRTGMVRFRRGDGAFMPCSTLYLAVETTDLRAGESLYSIHASVRRSGEPDAPCPEPTPDAGPPPDAGAPDAGALDDASVELDGGMTGGVGGGGSCGCRVVGQASSGARSGGAPWALFAFGLLLVGRLGARRARRAAQSRRRSAAS